MPWDSHIIKYGVCAQDEALTAEMLRLAQPGGRLTVSTAYLNLARPFHRALASASKVSVLSEVMKSSRQLPV